MDPAEEFPGILDNASIGWVNLFLLLDDPETPWYFLLWRWLDCRSGTG
jgi:hypothetical protein